jgi:HSP20 family molecular chaperone IbpA
MSDLELKIDAAGIDPKLLKVTVVDNVLRVYRTDKPSHFRVLPIWNPKLYDIKAARASYKFGLLTITIPAVKPIELDIPITIEWSS